MKRSLRPTGDGSYTLYLTDLDEPYHSINGAIQESMHIFIEYGFHSFKGNHVKILEFGFGTGLNMLLTLKHATTQNCSVYYHAVEKYPVQTEEYQGLNYCEILGESFIDPFYKAHSSEWNRTLELTNNFTLYKELADFRDASFDYGFNIIYFDAFAPTKQPELWNQDLFRKIYNALEKQGVWVSYTAKGSVKRDLISVGFKVEKIPGPPGKREMMRAWKV